MKNKIYWYYRNWSYMGQGDPLYDGINIIGLIFGTIVLPLILITKVINFVLTTPIYKKDRD